MVGDILQPTHLLFVLVIALLVLGPKRLPEVGRSLGRGLRDFKTAMSGDDHDRPEEIVRPTPDTNGATFDEPEVASVHDPVTASEPDMSSVHDPVTADAEIASVHDPAGANRPEAVHEHEQPAAAEPVSGPAEHSH